MYNVEDILARLQKGESADAVAQEFADALNDAIAKNKAAEEAKYQKEQKIMDTQNLIDTVVDYLNKYYKELLPEEELDDVDIEAVIETLDNTAAHYVKLIGLMKELDSVLPKAEKKRKPVKLAEVVVKEAEDPIAKFFRENGLI